MHVVNAAVLDKWTALPDEAVVAHVPQSLAFLRPGCDRVVAAVLSRIC